jgi:hypothetical protein
MLSLLTDDKQLLMKADGEDVRSERGVSGCPSV